MTLSDEIKTLVSTLEMQLNGFAKAAYEKDLRIADLERQLAEASAPAVEPKYTFSQNDDKGCYEVRDILRNHVADIFYRSDMEAFQRALSAPAAPQAADTDKVREALANISNNQITEAWESCGGVGGFYKSFGYQQFAHTVLDLAADTVCSMAAQAPVREVPGWVSVKDRLPDMHTEVMVWPHPSDECMTAEVRGDGTWYYSEYTAHHGWDSVMLAVGRVTHWMPLPAAPVQQEGV